MKNQIRNYINLWENRCYSDGIPDEAPIEIDDLVPSYKRIATAILKNNLKHIGIEPVKSEWYGILKCIELGKQYKKPKTMTQQETKEYVFRLINTLVDKQCYIKGYGSLFRVCDQSHTPLLNISKQHMEILLHNKIVIRKNLIFVLDVVQNPYSHQIEIKIPDKK